MASEFGLTSRRAGRLLAAVAAVAVIGLATYTAVSESVPVLHLYDGYWMLGGAAIAVALLAPLVWQWPRERALAILLAGVTVGAWSPLVVSAIRVGMPIRFRLRSAIFLSSADIIGVALPVGVALAWLALKEYRPGDGGRSPSDG